MRFYTLTLLENIEYENDGTNRDKLSFCISCICDGYNVPIDDAYSSGHLLPSDLGLAYSLLLKPFSRTCRDTEDAHSYGHVVLSHSGLPFVLILRLLHIKPVMFPDFDLFLFLFEF